MDNDIFKFRDNGEDDGSYDDGDTDEYDEYYDAFIPEDELDDDDE